jgi:hypothetical protein
MGYEGKGSVAVDDGTGFQVCGEILLEFRVEGNGGGQPV